MAGNKQLICDAEALTDGGRGVRFTILRHGLEEPAFAVRYAGAVHAFLNRCGHIPAELDWSEGEFFDLSGLYLMCATHGAMYLPDSGRCVGGPCAGRGLVPLAVEETDGKVFLID
jgi:nitrite reductase/ring-hydroxylating ferredoxin subunit